MIKRDQRNLCFVLKLTLFLFSISTSEILLASDTRSAQEARSSYQWMCSLQLNNGLLESTHDSHFVSLYENSLAAIVFCVYEDPQKAEKFFKFFENRLDDEFRTGPGGFGQFRDHTGKPHGGTPHRWMGDNAWLLIALNIYHQQTGSNRFHKLAENLEKWLRRLQDPSDGGVWGGFDRYGTQIHKVTEGNLDVFNAVPGYDAYHQKILEFLKNERFDPDTEQFLAWPENARYRYALDCTSWGFTALPHMPASMLSFAKQFYTEKSLPRGNQHVAGFCFDMDHDTIWLEGTLQMVIAYQQAQLNKEASFYLKESEKCLLSSPKRSRWKALPYATHPGTGYGGDPLWEGAATNLSLTPTAWYLMAKKQFDPLALGRKKKIPRDHQFWRSSSGK